MIYFDIEIHIKIYKYSHFFFNLKMKIRKETTKFMN